ncbi:MAG: DUF4271 domain-containing protein [Muribaculaceae bacterium]|nr:DUF4271 domain-containing protein [Muribaculaceae bacterium]
MVALPDSLHQFLFFRKIFDVPTWQSGLEPVLRPGHAGHDQGLVACIVVLILAVAVSFDPIKRIFRGLTKKLWSVRIRDSFDQTTASEQRVLLLLILQTIVYEAVIANAAMATFSSGTYLSNLATTGVLAVFLLVYYIFQLTAYSIVGYTFASDTGRTLWLEGFTSTQTLLGFTLIIPGLMVLFYPDLTEIAIWLSAGLYLIARVIFISKGFRIFYTNVPSLVYFILYLCSLEIIPIFILFQTAVYCLQLFGLTLC